MLIGMAVMSPAGSILLYILAAIAALIPAISSIGGLRITGIAALAASLVFLTVTYPKYDVEMTRYKQHSHQKTSEGAKPAPPIKPP